MSYRSALLACFASIAVISIGCGGGSNDTGTAGSSGGSSAGGSGGSAGLAGNGGSGPAGSGPAGTGPAGSGGSGPAGAGGGAAGRGGAGGGPAGAGGGSAGRGGSAGTGTGGGTGGASAFKITSPMLADGAVFPDSATCEATGTRSLLPELNWDGVPAGTMSFALAFVDTTILAGNPSASTGHHSVMWDIPAAVRQVPEGLPAGSPPTGIAALAGSKQKNPLSAAYLGPCPNHTAEDTYNFELYAMSQAMLPANTANMNVVQIRALIMSMNPLGKAVLAGRSNAMGSLK